MNLTHLQKQLILYTKGHYKKSVNLVDDLKIIVGEEYGLSFEHTEMYSIYNFIIEIYDKLVESGYIAHSQSPTKYLLTKIYSRDLKREDNSLLTFMLGEISIVLAKGLNLGEKDENIQSNIDELSKIGVE